MYKISSGDNGLCHHLEFMLVFWIHIVVCSKFEEHDGVVVGHCGCICVVPPRYTPVLRDLLCDLCSTTLF